MHLNPLAEQYAGYTDSLLNNSVQADLLKSTTTNGSSGFSASSHSGDSSKLSPLAQILSTLQHLQEKDLNQYQQVTQTIANNLETAAQTADSSGQAEAAGQLSQLATDFTNASVTGELPNIQDLANTIGYPTPAKTDPEDRWSFTSPSPPAVSTNPALDPVSIILNTLASSGTISHTTG
jgi:hypothetical protein